MGLGSADRNLESRMREDEAMAPDTKVNVMCPMCKCPQLATPVGDQFLIDIHPPNDDECAGSESTVGKEYLVKDEAAA